jgi:hypothetical protein
VPIIRGITMNDSQGKKPVSSEKLAANRKNAERSTGPRTPAGKQRSSQNHYHHGFYAQRPFPTKELLAQDWEGYNRILSSYREHYSPVGDREIAILLRLEALKLRNEQTHLRPCHVPAAKENCGTLNLTDSLEIFPSVRIVLSQNPLRHRRKRVIGY